MKDNRKLVIACVVLLLVHLGVLFAGFLAPYDPATQNRNLPFAPPTPLHFVDSHGKFHFRPFVCEWIPRPDGLNQYDESCQSMHSVRFFVTGNTYKMAGLITTSVHLFGVDEPGQIFLAGTDNYGRDQFSRILYGGRVSLSAGLLATSLSLFLGLLIGSTAGFYGGWLDEVLMRTTELFLVLPWLYLLLGVRAFLPLHIEPMQAFFLLVGVIGTIGWARPARLIRGTVLSAKSRKYVLASRGFGASDFYILRRHVLPHTYGVLLTQAALLVPQYVLAEVALSFFGLGLGEPIPSWGNLLASLQQYSVLTSYWWMFLPAVTLVVISLGYLGVANTLHKRLQSVAI